MNKIYLFIFSFALVVAMLQLASVETAAQDAPVPPAAAPKTTKKAKAATDLSKSARAGEFVNMSDEKVLSTVRTDELDQCIAASLKALASYQKKNGSFGQNATVTATTALSGLTFLASGSTPSSGPYSKNIREIIDWLLIAQNTDTGFINAKGDTRSAIHGHGFATMFLATCYGHLVQEDAKEVKTALDLAVACALGGQTTIGGWGYYPSKRNFDEGSTTVCVLQGIRAARDAGISVDKSVIANAMEYISKTKEKLNFSSPMQEYRGKSFEGFTFKYSYSSGRSSKSWALCAASCSSLNNIGVYSGFGSWDKQSLTRVLHGGMRYLFHHSDDFFERFRRGRHSLDTSHFPYAIFYATQSFWQYSNRSYFLDFFPKVRDHYIAAWRAGGKKGFTKASYGKAYATSFSLLSLLLPYQYLPAFQR